VQQQGEHRRFFRAEQLVREVPVLPLEYREGDHQVHLWIANEEKWLLNHFLGANSPKQLRGRYHGLLYARGLANYDGMVLIEKLQEEFHTFYSEELLSQLHCRLDSPWNWLMRIMQPKLMSTCRIMPSPVSCRRPLILPPSATDSTGRDRSRRT